MEGVVRARVKEGLHQLPDPNDVGVVGSMTRYEGKVLEFTVGRRSDGGEYYTAKGYAWCPSWLDLIPTTLDKAVEL